MKLRCPSCGHIFEGEAAGKCSSCVAGWKPTTGTNTCCECYRHFSHRPIMRGRRDFCSEACLALFRATPKGSMQNKGSRTTPVGKPWQM